MANVSNSRGRLTVADGYIVPHVPDELIACVRILATGIAAVVAAERAPYD